MTPREHLIITLIRLAEAGRRLKEERAGHHSPSGPVAAPVGETRETPVAGLAGPPSEGDEESTR